MRPNIVERRLATLPAVRPGDRHRSAAGPSSGRRSFARSEVAAHECRPSAAEYVLSIGGTIRVDGQDRDIKSAVDLPREEFRLAMVILTEIKQVNDEGLTHFKDATNLTDLQLQGTRVTDAGLAHFKDLKNLRNLNLGYTQVGDAGLANFKDCKNLTHLHLEFTQVSDAGLAQQKDRKDLTYLNLLRYPGERRRFGPPQVLQKLTRLPCKRRRSRPRVSTI